MVNGLKAVAFQTCNPKEVVIKLTGVDIEHAFLPEQIKVEHSSVRLFILQTEWYGKPLLVGWCGELVGYDFIGAQGKMNTSRDVWKKE